MDHLKVIRERDLDNLPLSNLTNLLQFIAKTSIGALLKRDANLIMIGSKEPSLCHRLGVYLEKFTDLDVDCEYNRRGVEHKRLAGMSPSGRIATDLIIHRRLRREYNALAIEMKLSRNDRAHNDIERLLALVDENGDFGYRLGLFLEIANRPEEIRRENMIKAQLQWIQSNGVIQTEEILRDLNPRTVEKLCF